MTQSKITQLLAHYQQWLARYEECSPEQKANNQTKYQAITQAVAQLQQIPTGTNLQDPLLMEAAQEYWEAVRYAQALLLED